MTEEQLPVPVTAEPVPVVHILDIEDPAIGLAVQFVIAAMLHQGLAELQLSKELMGQAFRKQATSVPDETGFTVTLQRDQDLAADPITLPAQFLVATLLHLGLAEMRLTTALMDQASTKLIWAIDEGEHFSFGIHR